MLAHELLAQLKTQLDFQPTGEPAANLTLGRGRLHGQLVYLAIIERNTRCQSNHTSREPLIEFSSKSD